MRLDFVRAAVPGQPRSRIHSWRRSCRWDEREHSGQEKGAAWATISSYTLRDFALVVGQRPLPHRNQSSAGECWPGFVVAAPRLESSYLACLDSISKAVQTNRRRSSCRWAQAGWGPCGQGSPASEVWKETPPVGCRPKGDFAPQNSSGRSYSCCSSMNGCCSTTGSNRRNNCGRSNGYRRRNRAGQKPAVGQSVPPAARPNRRPC